MLAGDEDLRGKGGEGGRRASSTASSKIFSLFLIAWCREFDFSLILETILSTVSEDILAEAANPWMSSEKLFISLRRSDKLP
jgi:hypothetical protein